MSRPIHNVITEFACEIIAQPRSSGRYVNWTIFFRPYISISTPTVNEPKGPGSKNVLAGQKKKKTFNADI